MWVQFYSEGWGDVIVDICPELGRSRLGGEVGFYNLRASAASLPWSVVEKHLAQFEVELS